MRSPPFSQNARFVSAYRQRKAWVEVKSILPFSLSFEPDFSFWIRFDTFSNSSLAFYVQNQDTYGNFMITFSTSGVPLPPGMVDITKERFETEFGELDDRPVRQPLVASWNQWMADLLNIVEPDSWDQWLGGSFTTNKKDPQDVDVVNFIDEPSAKELVISRTPYFFDKANPGSCSKVKYKVDSYLVAVYPTTDPRHRLVTKRQEAYWTDLFGKSRAKENRSIFKLRVR
jgi:hypothetical protein